MIDATGKLGFSHKRPLLDSQSKIKWGSFSSLCTAKGVKCIRTGGAASKREAPKWFGGFSNLFLCLTQSPWIHNLVSEDSVCEKWGIVRPFWNGDFGEWGSFFEYLKRICWKWGKIWRPIVGSVIFAIVSAMPVYINGNDDDCRSNWRMNYFIVI